MLFTQTVTVWMCWIHSQKNNRGIQAAITDICQRSMLCSLPSTWKLIRAEIQLRQTSSLNWLPLVTCDYLSVTVMCSCRQACCVGSSWDQWEAVCSCSLINNYPLYTVNVWIKSIKKDSTGFPQTSFMLFIWCVSAHSSTAAHIQLLITVITFSCL